MDKIEKGLFFYNSKPNFYYNKSYVIFFALCIEYNSIFSHISSLIEIELSSLQVSCAHHVISILTLCTFLHEFFCATHYLLSLSNLLLVLHWVNTYWNIFLTVPIDLEFSHSWLFCQNMPLEF